MQNYYGLIELVFVFGGVTAFVVWQMRQLNRDIKAREEREAREQELRNEKQGDDPA